MAIKGPNHLHSCRREIPYWVFTVNALPVLLIAYERRLVVENVISFVDDLDTQLRLCASHITGETESVYLQEKIMDQIRKTED